MSGARKVGALFKKDLKDSAKNGNVMILLALPVLFALLYRFIDIGGMQLPGEMRLMYAVLMNVCLVPTSFLAMIIAEEKEKNTLRTLMLSNVSAGQFLLSKALVTFLYMQLVNLAVFFVAQQPVEGLVRFLTVTSAASLCMISVGALTGMVSRDQMSTSIILVPFMLLFMLPPIFGPLNELFGRVAKFVPTNAMLALYFGVEPNVGFWQGSTGFHLCVLVLWTLAAGAAFVAAFKKGMLDH